MALSDVKVRNAKTQEKQKKLYDTDGMYLLVTPPGTKSPEGGKCWRLKYRFDGKEKTLALGTYPEISLGEARKRTAEAREQLAKGIDPGAVKRAKKAARAIAAANSFEVIAREWHEKYKKEWKPDHAVRKLTRFEKEVFPWIGSRPIADITAPELLTVLRKVEGRGALDTAHRIRFDCGKVFLYAIATARGERNPAEELRGALPPARFKNFAAPTKPDDVGRLLLAIEGYKGTYVVRSALQLAPLLFVRPGELRHAEWSEFDLDNALWDVPARRMKEEISHLVPLSAQALQVLKDLWPLTQHSKYVFPNLRSPLRCMSENAVNCALRCMGFGKEEVCGHGLRATARTMIRERLHADVEYIEIQLAHATKSPNGTAYDRVSFLPERREMMQMWADYLDELKASARGGPTMAV